MNPLVADSDKGQIAGICSTCIHIDDCLHRLRSGVIIWFCEQFDDRVEIKPRSPRKRITETQGTDSQEGYLGLCVNCENRAECVHSKTPGGIWYCEEYR